jgi:hypothetical protein
VQFACVDPTSAAVIDVAGQGVQLLNLKQAFPDAGSQLCLGEVTEQELGLENPAQVSVGPVETVLGGA